MSASGTETEVSAADEVRRHYQPNGDRLLESVMQILDGMGGGPLHAEQLAGLDQFHVRGLAATVELGKLLDLQPDDEVLDAGSGLGGPSRFFAETYACQVTGVDLAPSLVDVARLLAARTDLSDRVGYQVGDLTALPMADARFDVAYSQHVAMNIANRAGLYAQLRRGLKPAGRFGFYDVLAVEGAPAPTFPLPWAATSAASTLLTEDEMRSMLDQAQLVPRTWNDVTAQALDWAAQLKTGGPAAGANLGIVMGAQMAVMTGNLMRNLADNRLRLVMAVCDAR